MTWWDEEARALAGTVVRRRSWLADAAQATKQIVFVAGAGTQRAVAVVRSSGVADAVVTPTTFGAADYLGDDWEEVGSLTGDV